MTGLGGSAGLGGSTGSGIASGAATAGGGAESSGGGSTAGGEAGGGSGWLSSIFCWSAALSPSGTRVTSTSIERSKDGRLSLEL